VWQSLRDSPATLENDGEFAAHAEVRHDSDLAAVEMHDVFDDGKAEPRAAELTASRLVDAIEACSSRPPSKRLESQRPPRRLLWFQRTS